MHTAQCHCGNVQLTIHRLTEDATSCNCSVCRRYGALWGYFTQSEVNVSVGEHGLEAYEHGDRMISFKRCGHCGCVTHYTATPKWGSDRVAVNYRMFPNDIVASLRIRHFDGADTWQYLEE